MCGVPNESYQENSYSEKHINAEAGRSRKMTKGCMQKVNEKADATSSDGVGLKLKGFGSLFLTILIRYDNVLHPPLTTNRRILSILSLSEPSGNSYCST